MSDAEMIKYHQFVNEYGAMCYDVACISQPSSDLFDPDNPDLQAVAVGQGGRQAAWFVDAGFGRAVLRHYRRGGAIARLSKDRYVWRSQKATRSWAEFQVLSYLSAQGLAVPRPLAAAYWRTGLFYRAAILIERIENVRTLTELVRESADPNSEVQQQVAQVIFQMHEADCWHADLNAYNILLDRSGKAWLIDFDKAVQGPVPTSRRAGNLSRLLRSLRKVSPQTADVWWKGINWHYKTLEHTKNGTAP